jgi:flagellar basal body P-ring protein FlgI
MNDKKTNHYSTIQITDLESTSGNEPLAKGESDKVVKKCSIHIHSKRKRLADPSGISHKACIDGLRDAGVFPDDSSKFIKEVTESQEISKDEKTVITVEWEE